MGRVLMKAILIAPFWRASLTGARPTVTLAEYVITHEWAHLVLHQHGPEFWTVLDRSMPDWEKQQQELIQDG